MYFLMFRGIDCDKWHFTTMRGVYETEDVAVAQQAFLDKTEWVRKSGMPLEYKIVKIDKGEVDGY
jgi:hypothetical protein